MATYQLSTLVDLVRKRVRDPNYDGTEITQYLNDTQNDVCNEYRLKFMETYHDYTTVANVADITNGTGLPTNFQVGIDMVDITAGGYTFIPYKDIVSLDQIYGNPTDSIPLTANNPTYWYMYAGVPQLFPVPTTSKTLRFRYYLSPTDLANDGDVPIIPAAFKEVLVLGAAYRVLQIKDNYDQAGILQNKYDEILQKLVNQRSVNQVGSSQTARINRYSIAKRNF
jgi:hypothetical protein